MRPKQLVIELPDEDHKAIKASAARLGMSMKRYVLTALGLFKNKTNTPKINTKD